MCEILVNNLTFGSDGSKNKDIFKLVLQMSFLHRLHNTVVYLLSVVTIRTSSSNEFNFLLFFSRSTALVWFISSVKKANPFFTIVSFEKIFFWYFIREGVGTSNFTTTTSNGFHYIKSGFLVDHYYDITTLKMTFLLITTSTIRTLKRKVMLGEARLGSIRLG
jgi:hypothetical protein